MVSCFFATGQFYRLLFLYHACKGSIISYSGSSWQHAWAQKQRNYKGSSQGSSDRSILWMFPSGVVNDCGLPKYNTCYISARLRRKPCSCCWQGTAASKPRSKTQQAYILWHIGEAHARLQNILASAWRGVICNHKIKAGGCRIC